MPPALSLGPHRDLATPTSGAGTDFSWDFMVSKWDLMALYILYNGIEWGHEIGKSMRFHGILPAPNTS